MSTLSPELGEKAPSSARLSVPPTDIESSATSTTESVIKIEAPAPVRTVTGAKWFLLVLSVLSSTFLFALDNTVVADIQASVIARFGEIEKLSWLGIAFILAGCSTILTWSKAYGTFNPKWLYISSVIVFEGGSALCGGAPNMNALIIGRALAGVGGSGMYLGTLTLLTITTTVHERPTYIGLTGLMWGIGTVLGPVVGGAFAESSATWRWAFYINLLIGAAFAPVYFMLLPGIDPHPEVTVLERVKKLDFLGIILNIGWLCCIIMAVNFGGTVYDWDSGQIIALFVVGGVLIVVFAITQSLCVFTTVEDRVFPVQFVTRPFMCLLFAMMASAGTAIFIPTYYIPLFFQFVKGDSPLDAAVRLLPFILILVFFCIVNGAGMTKTGYYMPWYLLGGIGVIIGGALMSVVSESTSVAEIYGYTILIGFGAGCFIQASFSVAQAKVEPNEVPLTVGFISLAQSFGIVIALAISGSVFLNEAFSGMTDILPGVPRDTVKGAIAGAGSAFFESLDESKRGEVLHAIIEAMGKTYILVIVAGAVVTVGSIFMPREKLFLEAGHVG
ncbi:uncharacterized protein H6S33_003416 [Morchella sextelata]|uniref:uncharacterized protein n=1 Tax=Morchella sextelata TaxID=1174677 RepID=UPI001D048633|nr:uncharacterized protein H6S33_003416 [Morchella sextelata]KAH0606582.1 hypothetical protein H6S33_003416 [Morchella sextelata]